MKTSSIINMDKVAGELFYDGVDVLANIGIAAVVFLSFLLASVVAKKVILKLAAHKYVKQEAIFHLLAKVCKAAIIILGAVTAMGTAGLNVGALVASLGLTGFALGFAFKDFLSNILAGVMILVYQPFRQGDFIKISGYEGTIQSIDLRYTVLVGEGLKVLVPNSKLLSSMVTVKEKAGN